MNNVKLFSYNPSSESAKILSQKLGIKRIKHEGSHIRVDKLINWGASSIHRNIDVGEYLNTPDAVATAANKLQAFKKLAGTVGIPSWTESREEAFTWLLEDVKEPIVCVRHKLNGHSGDGLVLVRKDEEIPLAPLYTKYVPKKEEYRIHVFRDEVFFVQRKARKRDVPDDQVNWKIRNHANGFIFAHQNVDVSEEVKNMAILAVSRIGLDFGAVDVILGVDKKWYVLEVNTACGLEGATVDAYVEQFKKVMV